MNIQLDKPIIFFDLETTGLDLANDRVIQLAATKVFPDGKEESINMRFNPEGREIHPQATEKHHMTAEMLENEPTFYEKADELLAFFEGCHLGGFNLLHFDIPVLIEEFARCKKDFDPMKSKAMIVDAYKLHARKVKRDLSTLYSYYTGKTLDDAHDASVDNMATMAIFEEQVKQHGIASLEEANRIVREDDNGNAYLDFSGVFLKTKENKFIYGIGKHKGREVGENEETIGYLTWILNKSTHNNSTKFVGKKLMDWIRKAA